MLLKSLVLILAQLVLAAPVVAQKLMLAHVAINPSQAMLHLAKDSGMLAKYGFTADVLLIPGTPRTVQALIAGDLDYVAANRIDLEQVAELVDEAVGHRSRWDRPGKAPGATSPPRGRVVRGLGAVAPFFAVWVIIDDCRSRTVRLPGNVQRDARRRPARGVTEPRWTPPTRSQTPCLSIALRRWQSCAAPA